MTQARIVSVNMVHAIVPDPLGDVGRTAIDKRAVGGPVTIQALGPVGDTVLDRKHHGGRDQAVYAYAAEDLRRGPGCCPATSRRAPSARTSRPRAST